MPQIRQPGREGWPRGLYESRPGYFIYREKRSKINRAIGQVSIEEAIKWVAENSLVDVLAREQRSRVKRSPEWRHMQTTTFHRAKTRARLAGRECMTREEFDRIWARAGGFCELSGIELSPRPADAQGKVHPWAASLDRIENSEGYTYGNCRIVCVAMNVALNEFGESVFRRLAVEFIARQMNNV